MDPADRKVWLITGSSDGLGWELACSVARRGDHVAATSRRPQRVASLAQAAGHRIMTPYLDLNDDESVHAAVSSTLEEHGRIDVVVNNAGTGLIGAIEECSDGEARSILEVNVLGLLRVIRAVLPGMRDRGSGRIVNISSIGGLRGRAGIGLYSAGKFAYDGISESLRQEVGPLGVSVLVVYPGRFVSGFMDKTRLASHVIDDYSSSVGPVRGSYDHDYPAGIPTAKDVAATVHRAADSEPMPGRIWIGEDAVSETWMKIESLTHDLRVSSKMWPTKDA